jgi:hypothetical protein
VESALVTTLFVVSCVGSSTCGLESCLEVALVGPFLVGLASQMVAVEKTVGFVK